MCTPAPWIRSALLGAALVGLMGTPAAAQTFSSGSTGADGAFNPTSNTTLPLPPTGIFNYTTINIPTGVTVTFTRNGANTPVILLATGNVTINGTLDVSGQNATAFGRPGAGGPGGFDGGGGADGLTTALGGSGLGPGGGGGGTAGGGGGGGYLTGGGGGSGGTPGSGGPAYGSPALRPILGGSGGGAGGTTLNVAPGGGGGGGGGAILIASSTSIALGASGSTITIRANGGNGSDGCGSSGCGAGGGGSGGAIRVIAPTLTGVGQLRAQGGTTGYPYNGGAGASGRIRLEAATLSYTGSTTPLATAALPQPVFPGTGQPSLTIASVGGIPAPATPSGNILAAPDILLPTGTTNPVNVSLAATNIPLGTTILVTATPQSGAKASATSTGLSGSLASATATASLTLSLTQTSVLTASASFPLVASMGTGTLYAHGPVPSPADGGIEGEEVTHVRVAATFGGASTVSYLTASGKEVPAEQLAWRW